MPRNGSGVYTLPAGNPVEPGTTIDAAWANDTLEDMANEITNSLSRTGAGGMIAPFRIADGNVTAPGLAFTNETNSGLYRSGAGSLWMSILGVNTVQFTTTGVNIPAGKTVNLLGGITTTTLDVTVEANIALATLTGTTKLGASTGTESLRVSPAALAVNYARVYGGALGAGPTIDAQGSDTNINLNLAAKGSGSVVSASPVALGSTLSVTGAITATGGVTGQVTSSNAVLTGGTINNMVIGGSTPQTITGTTITSTVGFVGNLTGNVTGNTAGTHTGAVVGNVTGNVTGNLTGNVTAASGTSTFENVVINGSLDMNSATGSTITGLSTPTADSDAANKAYVDSVAQGIDAKASCLAATTANITLSGTQTIDGVAVSAGQRVLVKNQTSAAQNGIYVAAAGAWARATDADTWNELVSAYTFIEQGTDNGNNGFICTVTAGGTLGTTPVTWVQFSGAGQINAGTGMSKTGNTLNVNTASSSRIVVGADEIDLATTGITPGTYKSLTIDAYGRATAGTNPTTLSGYGITDAYTIAQIDALFGSTTSAAASAAAAATSASNAATSATNASNSATAAAGSATSAANTYTNFNNQYLGSKASDPSVNNSGGALVAGNLYWNSTANEMRVYTGTTWLTAYLPATGYLALSGGTMTGSIAFNGAGLKITGDLSNATISNRLLIQSSTANGNTGVVAVPNGTATTSTWRAYNAVDADNASVAILGAFGATDVRVSSDKSGTGSYLPLTFFTGGSERGRIAAGGNWLIGSSTDNNTDKLQVTGSMSLSSALRVGATPSAGTAGQVLTSAGAGAAPTWSSPSTGPSGAETRTDSATLTNSSKCIQALNMPAYGKYIRLPDATTLTAGPGLFVLDNSVGKFPVGVLDGAGTVLGQVLPGDVTSFDLKSIATTAGDWSTEGNLDPWWIDSNTGLDLASTIEPQFFALDSTRSFIYYRKPTTGYPALRMVTYASAGVAPTISAELIVRAASTTLNYTISKLVGTNRLLCTTNDGYVMLVDLSNAATLSVGTAVALTFTNGAINNYVVLDSQYVVGYTADETSYVLRAKCLDCGASGTTVTVGSEASSSTYGNGGAGFVDVSKRGTGFIGIYGDYYNPNGWYDYFFYTLTRTTGTTLSFSAKLGNPTGSRTDTADQPFYAYVNIATDKILMPYWANSFAGRYVVVTWASGATPTFGTVASSSISANAAALSYASSPDGTRFIAWNQSNANSKFMEAVTVSGTTVTVGAATAYTSDATVNGSSTAFIGVDNNGRGVVNWTSSAAWNGAQKDKIRTFSLSGTTFTFGSEISSSYLGGMANSDNKTFGSLQNQSPGLFYYSSATYSSSKYYGITEFFTINADLSRNVINTIQTEDQVLYLYGYNGITDRVAAARTYAPPTSVGSENFVVFLNGKVKRGNTMWRMCQSQVQNGAADYNSRRYLPAAFIYPDDRNGRNASLVTYQLAGA